MSIKKVLLSYDYELYFNECFCDEYESLIKPTDLIIDAYLERGVRCTFFVDTECILKYKEIGKNDVVMAIENQLARMVKNGFDVQLHIHPLWESAEYCNGHFSFDYDRYDLKRFSLNEISVFIERGKNYLDALLKNVNPLYECIAFRAGGFCLPNNELFATTLFNKGFLIDSSIAPNTILDSKYQSFDYCGRKSILKSDNIKEVPILTAKRLNLFYLLNHKKAPLKAVLRGKGSPVLFNSPKICRLFNSIRENALITLDNHNYIFIKNCLLRNRDDIVSILGHPKLEDETIIKNTSDLISSTNELFDYLTFAQFAETNCDKKDI